MSNLSKISCFAAVLAAGVVLSSAADAARALIRSPQTTTKADSTTKSSKTEVLRAHELPPGMKNDALKSVPVAVGVPKTKLDQVSARPFPINKIAGGSTSPQAILRGIPKSLKWSCTNQGFGEYKCTDPKTGKEYLCTGSDGSGGRDCEVGDDQIPGSTAP